MACANQPLGVLSQNLSMAKNQHSPTPRGGVSECNAQPALCRLTWLHDDFIFFSTTEYSMHCGRSEGSVISGVSLMCRFPSPSGLHRTTMFYDAVIRNATNETKVRQTGHMMTQLAAQQLFLIICKGRSCRRLSTPDGVQRARVTGRGKRVIFLLF